MAGGSGKLLYGRRADVTNDQETAHPSVAEHRPTGEFGQRRRSARQRISGALACVSTRSCPVFSTRRRVEDLCPARTIQSGLSRTRSPLRFFSSAARRETDPRSRCAGRWKHLKRCVPGDSGTGLSPTRWETTTHNRLAAGSNSAPLPVSAAKSPDHRPRERDTVCMPDLNWLTIPAECDFTALGKRVNQGSVKPTGTNILQQADSFTGRGSHTN